MATGGLYGSTSTGTVAPQSGSESVGLYGNNTVFGGSYFEYLIFLDSASTPATPTGGSWSFVTNTGTPPTGWTNNPPQTPTGKVWISIALVNSKSTATLTWSTPGIFANPAGTGTVTSVAALTLTTAGTDVSSTVSNPTIAPVITLNLPTASATNRGALSAADWTTFNSKGSGTVTSVSGTAGRVTSTGGATPVIDLASGIATPGTTGSSALVPVITVDTYGRVTSITTAANPQGTVTSVTGTAPVVSSGGATPAISMAAATASVSGYLTSTDWSTFNSKGSGSVTSVAATVPSFLSVTGSPITTSGTLAIGYSGTALPVVNGGTGATTSTGTGSVVLSTSPSLTTPTQVTYENWTPITAPSYSEGRVWYDSDAHALAYYNDAANSVAHVGHELQVKVINNTGSSIPNGSPVYITSTTSGQTYPNIALAKADVAATASVIGLTNGAIANGAFGYVTSTGTIDDVNTGTFTVGQVLYLSPYSAGQLMNTLPPTGITVQVGVVEYVNTSTGKIYVKQTTPLAVPASIITGAVAIANGGTGQTTQAAAITALAGTQASGQYLRSNGTNTLLSAIQAADVPTLNQNTTGTASNVTGLVAIANGGTGTATPNLVAGTNVTITGTWPNQTIAASGGSGGSPGGSTTQVQYNLAGAFAGSANMTFDGTTLTAAGLAGPHNGTVGATTANTGSFTSLAYSTTLTGGTGIVNLGSGQFYKDASGNVGIGTTSPSQKLQVANGNIYISTTNYLMWNSGGSYAIDSDASTRLSFYSGSGTERMRIDSSGKVGIGTTSPSVNLEVAGASGQNIYVSYTSGSQLRLKSDLGDSGVGTTGATPLLFLINNGEKARIDSSGNILIGTSTSPAGSKELVLGGDYIEGVVAIGNSGTAQTLSLANGTLQTVTMTGNCTFTMPTAIAGKSFILILSTGAGSFTGTFTSVKWPNNTAPTITATASRWDIFTFVSNGTSWYGTSAQAYA